MLHFFLGLTTILVPLYNLLLNYIYIYLFTYEYIETIDKYHANNDPIGFLSDMTIKIATSSTVKPTKELTMDDGIMNIKVRWIG